MNRQRPLWLTLVIVTLTVIAAITYYQASSRLVDSKPVEPKITPVSQSIPVILVDPKLIWNTYEANKIAKKFKAKKLGHSKNRAVPKKIKKRMNTWWVNQGKPPMKKWWTRSLNHTECIWHHQITWQGLPAVSALGAGFCVKYGQRPTVVKINREITKLRVVCGGTAIIAGLGGVAQGGAGGAIVGMGSGAAGCVYGRYSDKFMDWLYD